MEFPFFFKSLKSSRNVRDRHHNSPPHLAATWPTCPPQTPVDPDKWFHVMILHQNRRMCTGTWEKTLCFSLGRGPPCSRHLWQVEKHTFKMIEPGCVEVHDYQNASTTLQFMAFSSLLSGPIGHRFNTQPGEPWRTNSGGRRPTARHKGSKSGIPSKSSERPEQPSSPVTPYDG